MAHKKLFRNLGLIILFIFLTGQQCDGALLFYKLIYGNVQLDCAQERITRLSQDENGNVTIGWTGFGDVYRVRVKYEGNVVATHSYPFPLRGAEFHIDWASLQGQSNEVTIEFASNTNEFPEECLDSRTLQRPVDTPAVTLIYCPDLRLTSPLGGMANGMETFYWDALEGAVNYRINIYDNPDSASPLAGWDAGTATSLQVDVSVNAIGGESPLMVELLATDATGHGCGIRYEIAREAAPPAAVATPTCAENPSASYC